MAYTSSLKHQQRQESIEDPRRGADCRRLLYYRFAFKMDDPASGRVPPAAKSRRRRIQKYVEECDAATTKVIRLKANR
jgi:hypothetical protein